MARTLTIFIISLLFAAACGTGNATASDDSCKLEANEDGTYTLACGDASVVIPSHMANQLTEPCVLTDHGDGTYTISCGDENVHVTHAPEVRFTEPQEGLTVAGTVRVELEAWAPAGLASLDLLIDGTAAASFFEEPFVFHWDTTMLSGDRSLQAIVTDDTGRSATQSIMVTVLAPVSIFNPYAEVDWVEHGQYKANFHTHTTESDGQMSPAAKIDEYYSMGYSVLAITDHNRVTWTWDDHGRDADELGMVAVQGNEPSRHHHIGSYFNDYGGESTELHDSLEAIGQRGGLAMMFHPGRYDFETSWYVDLFTSYDFLVGMEVYNQGDRYPGDRALWDEVLSELMPARPVWGYSNDDAHNIGHVGRNWQTLILPELSEAAVRSAMEEGLFYFSYAPTRGNPAPTINSILVDDAEGSITIDASGFTDVHWISGGQVIQSGSPTIHVRSFDGYLRAELDGPAGTTYTQPFFVGDQAHGTVIQPRGMSVDQDGLPTQYFNRRPTIGSGWSTRAVPGGNSSHTTVAHLDSTVQTVDARHDEWEPLAQSSTWPPAANQIAMWNTNNTHGNKIQTRPTVVAATLLLATLRNDTNRTIAGIEISYDLGSWLPEENEHVFGHRVFFSLSGEPGSWRSIPELSSRFTPTTSEEEVPVRGVLDLDSWEPDAPLFILWADDNGPGGSTNTGTGREGAYTIDAFRVLDVRQES